MTKTQLIAAAALMAVPAAAFAQFNLGDTLSVNEAEIRAMLESKGYQIEEIEMEDGEIEVEYLDGGQEYELTLSAETGEILEIELENEDND